MKHTVVEIYALSQGGKHEADVFYPEDFASNVSARFPVVAFTHAMLSGGDRTPNAYKNLYDDIVSFGFVVVAPRTCPVLFCVDFYEDAYASIEALHKGLTHPPLRVSDFIDRERSGLIGQSMGGDAVVRGATDGDWIKKVNVKVAVALQPASYANPKTNATEIKVPIYLSSGTADM